MYMVNLNAFVAAAPVAVGIAGAASVIGAGFLGLGDVAEAVGEMNEFREGVDALAESNAYAQVISEMEPQEKVRFLNTLRESADGVIDGATFAEADLATDEAKLKALQAAFGSDMPDFDGVLKPETVDALNAAAGDKGAVQALYVEKP